MNASSIRIFIGIVFMAVASGASAAVYRCEVNGSLVYASHPCGKHAVKLDVHPQTYAPPSVAVVPRHASPRKPTPSRKSAKSVCPADALSSTELRNLRVGHVIMVCESADAVRTAWGRPDVVKHKLSHGHVREYWIYKGPRGKKKRSVIFRDGKVISFQK